MSSNIKWFNKSELEREAIKNILPCNISVDIGTGIRPHDFINSVICICFEPYAEYVDILKQTVSDKVDKIYVVEQKNWSEAIDCLTQESVDSVFLIDVIEHLTKEEGEVLLRRTEKIARKQIVIFTPLGFVAQHTLEGGKDAWGLNGAEWQEHKSGWLPEDFDDSWNVFACNDFHDHNNIGEKLDDPFGAFWAIKTFRNKTDFEYLKIFSAIYDAIRNVVRKVDQYRNDILIQISISNELKQHNEDLKQHNEELKQHNKELESAIGKLELDIIVAISKYNSLENSRPVRLARYIKNILK